MMAVNVFGSLPVFIVCSLAQHKFIGSIASDGLKG